jgi:polyisoprenoid-binding protein YceI
MSVLTRTKWAVDASHSTATFKVRHLGVANVTGTFKVFQGEIEHEGDAPEASGALEASDFDGAKVRITVDTTSLDTNHAQRDGHLKLATLHKCPFIRHQVPVPAQESCRRNDRIEIS